MCVLLLMLVAGFPRSSSAQQPQIAYIQPDQAAPGMTVALEIIAPASATGAFGVDGFHPKDVEIVLVESDDTGRVIVGPLSVLWSGRMIQVPIILVSQNLGGLLIGPVPFRVRVGMRLSNIDTFWIVSPQPAITINGSVTLGDGGLGGRISKGNTIVVDSLRLVGQFAQFDFNIADPDAGSGGNPRQRPIHLLSRGPVELSGGTLDLTANGKDGGPGGGGGGGGFSSSGGSGYTGGGNSGEVSESNTGSGGEATPSYGGPSLTGVPGGGSTLQDQGGGGGTGAVFGSSGAAGATERPSLAGGNGGGSGGGENLLQDSAYGGGGGGFGTPGEAGGGTGNNAGLRNGGRFIVPLQGGSGGGAGNDRLSTEGAGSGGGGGGAISLVTFSELIAQSVFFDARGDSGTTGNLKRGAGGGGSGGAIAIAAARGATFEGVGVHVGGGNGGAGSQGAGYGGKGGEGRIRIDGPLNDCPTCSISRAFVRGISIARPDSFATAFGEVSGVAADTINFTDSVRIFFRTRQSGWIQADTVRYRTSNGWFWRKTLPLFHESRVYVVAYAQVRNRETSPQNNEPQWLPSHISAAAIRHLASPLLSVSVDTLRFDCTKVGRCRAVSARLFNRGEGLATIDSIVVRRSANFTVPKSPSSIGGFASDTIQFEFCPAKAGADTAVGEIYSNDTLRRLVLIGCGSDRDERLSIEPGSIFFGRVRSGDCDTLTLLLRSVGTDTLRTSFADLLLSPFEILDAPYTIILAPSASRTITVRFCPQDSGDFRARSLLTGRADSIIFRGVGTRAILGVSPTLDLGQTCVGECRDVQLNLRNLGNDTLLLGGLSLEGVAVETVTPPLPIRISPYDSLEIQATLCPDTVGVGLLRLGYIGNPENAPESEVHFEITLLAFEHSHSLPSALCVGDSTEFVVTLTNSLSTVLTATAVTLDVGEHFSIHTPLPIVIGPSESRLIRVGFNASKIGVSKDTLRIRLTEGRCDTVLVVPLEGLGVENSIAVLPVLDEKAFLDFGEIAVGDCRIDSLLISNPCGVVALLRLPEFTAPFRLLSSASRDILVPADSTVVVHIEFCPDSGGLVSFSSAIEVEGTDPVALLLKGSGRSGPVVGKGRITIESAIAAVGDIADTKVVLQPETGFDSITELSGILRFDPKVIYPREVILSQQLALAGWTLDQRVLSPGSLRFTLRGTKPMLPGYALRVRWLALMSEQGTSLLSFETLASVPSQLLVPDSGEFMTVECPDQRSNVKGAGPYGIEAFSTGDEILIDLKLGTAGIATLSLSDLTGRSILFREISANMPGEYLVKLPLVSVSGGRYILTAESMGWRRSIPIHILH